MEKKIGGIHHITAMAGDPQRNYDFYTNVLGLRFIKKTVNFDAPEVYHFYYGDEMGNPGTVLTFFPFPDARRGIRGTGEISAVAFSAPSDSVDFWKNRLMATNINFSAPQKRFGEKYISLLDPDGMLIEIFFDKNADQIKGMNNGDIPEEFSIRKFYGATFMVADSAATMDLLSNTFGFNPVDSAENIYRFSTEDNNSRTFIDIVENKNLPPARGGAGSVHHIAWRTANDAEQLEWQKKISSGGIYVTDVQDRNYFHSIYFREPGGILFEIATDTPGFLIDEDIDSLGTELKLPPWFENRRTRIESMLPKLITSKNKKRVV